MSENQTMFDFGDGQGPVPAHRHQNPASDDPVGSLSGIREALANNDRTKASEIISGITAKDSTGGWVADSADVSDCSFVGPDARVYGSASVYGAWILDNAVVCGNAKIKHGTVLSENAFVGGNATIDYDCKVSGNARVDGDAFIGGWTSIAGNCHVTDLGVIDPDSDLDGDLVIDNVHDPDADCGAMEFGAYAEDPEFLPHRRGSMPGYVVRAFRMETIMEKTCAELGSDVTDGGIGEWTSVLAPGAVATIDTGVVLAVPEGYEMQVRELTYNTERGLSVVSIPGVVTHEHRSSLRIVVTNIGTKRCMLAHGNALAQILLKRIDPCRVRRMNKEISDE